MKMDNFVQPVDFRRTLRDKLSGLEYLVTGHYGKCGLNWCPKFPVFSKYELSVLTTPETATEFVVIKAKTSNVINGELFNWDAFTDELDDSEPELTNYRSQLGGLNRDVSPTFEPVIPDESLASNPYKRQVLVTANTSHMERSISSKISLLLDRQHWLKGQLNIQVIGNTGHAWKVKFNDVCNLMAVSPSSRADSEEFLHKMKLTWTLDGQEKYVKYKIAPGDRIVDIYETLRQHGLESTGSKLSAQYKYKFTLEAEISHADRTTLKYVTVGIDLLKRHLYKYVTVGIPSQLIHNKLIIAAEFIPLSEKMTLVVKSPRETDIVVDAPFYWNVLLPAHDKLSLHDQPAPTWLYSSNFTNINRDIVNYASPPNFYFDETSRECYMNQHVVKTFDGLTIPFTPVLGNVAATTGCELLIARDCSSDGNFAVLASGTSSSWGLQFLVPGHDIRWTWREALSITVNGEEKNVGSSQPIVVRKEPGDVSSQKLYKIEKLDDEWIKLECYMLGITVTVNCVQNTMSLKLSASSVLQGRLCGLCGNYNQQIGDEFAQSSKRTVTSFREYLVSNFVSSTTCQTSSVNIVGDTCMEKKPMTIRRRHNGQSLVCESDEPVETCRASCRPASADSWTSMDVCFTCRTEHDSQPFTAYRPPTHDFTAGSNCANYEQRINVPTACTAA